MTLDGILLIHILGMLLSKTGSVMSTSLLSLPSRNSFLVRKIQTRWIAILFATDHRVSRYLGNRADADDANDFVSDRVIPTGA